jgi:outer membrane protein
MASKNKKASHYSEGEAMTGFVQKARRLAAAALLTGLAAMPAGSQTLTDTLIAAYRTSGLLEQNRALLRAADEDVAQAVATLRPVLEYVASTNYIRQSDVDLTENNTGLSLDFTFLLYDFGRSQLLVDAQKETVLATRQALRGVEQQVLLRAVAAFLEVRRQNALVGLQQNNVRVITEQLRAAEDRFEVGEVTRTDVSIAEARLAAARSSLAAAQGGLAQAREEYSAVTGDYPAELAPAPPPPATAATLVDARDVARRRHPEILQAQHEVSAAELVIAAAKADLRPALRLTGNLGINDEGEDEQQLTLALRGPLYRGGALTSAIRQAQAQRDASRGSLYTSVQDVEQSVGDAWADVAVARATEIASEEEVAAGQLALRGAQEELEVGSRTTLDVLDREQELLDAQTTLISAQIDLIFANYALLSAMGLMSVDHLGLGIATYDPAAYYNAVKDAPTVYVSPQGERLDRVLKSIGRN